MLASYDLELTATLYKIVWRAYYYILGRKQFSTVYRKLFSAWLTLMSRCAQDDGVVSGVYDKKQDTIFMVTKEKKVSKYYS